MKKSYIKVTRTQVKAKIKKTGTFSGFLVGSKVSPAHYFSGWCLACEFNAITVEEFEKTLSSWQYYNSNSETGIVCHIYQYT